MTWELENTRERRAQRVRADVTMQINDAPTGRIMDAFQDRYILKKVVHSEFWSNSAQLETRRRHAERMADAHIYKDMIPLVHEILTDSDCDDVRRTAMTLLDMMQG